MELLIILGTVATVIAAIVAIWQLVLQRRASPPPPPQPSGLRFEVEVTNLFETYEADLGPWSFCVKGINRSDHPIRVTSAGFERGDGKQIVITQQPYGADLIRTLPPHDAGQTWMDCDSLAAAGLDVYGPIIGWVRTATGELYKSEPRVLRSP